MYSVNKDSPNKTAPSFRIITIKQLLVFFIITTKRWMKTTHTFNVEASKNINGQKLKVKKK